MPPVEAAELPWASMRSSPDRMRVFIQYVLKTNPVIQLADTVICNTFEEIESGALDLVPNALPVGPLDAPPASSSSSAAHFWPEDATCLDWLDAQTRGSVIYVAFGSLAVFDAARFEELADGLELTGRPFLWAVRPNFTDGVVGEVWLDAFKRRVEGKGMVVGWAPQQRVLSHPSVACFVSHCGWNSTMEGLRNGVPFLCLPYFADQFCNQSYVCNVWGTGVKLLADERGIVTKMEIKNKVAQLLSDEKIKARVAMWKEAACASIAEGGSSHVNLLKLVNLLREQ
jgi:UDP:flavonoid glycosyltransferase YjiC (YdhE family)